MRGGGLEPPWLLTASTSTREAVRDSNDLAELERQGTSANVTERRILATRNQNPRQPEPIADWLMSARLAWNETRDKRELRKILLRIMTALDE